jgi:hypothetical protein
MDSIRAAELRGGMADRADALVTKTSFARSAISTTLPGLGPAIRTIVLQDEMRPPMAFTCSGASIQVFSVPGFDRGASLCISSSFCLQFSQYLHSRQHRSRSSFLSFDSPSVPHIEVMQLLGNLSVPRAMGPFNLLFLF